MSKQQVRVTFQPSGRTIFILPGTTLLEAAAQAGLTIETPCGGAGTCGKCRVQMTSGPCDPGDIDRKHFNDEEIDAGWRLACQTAVCAECVVHVPDSSLFASQHQILTETTDEKAEVVPAVRKVFVELAAPTLEDDAADLYRLEETIGSVRTSLTVIRDLSRRLRECNYSGTAVITDHELIDFESGDTSDCCYGVAFDVGTTTVVGSLLDLRNGDELAIASAMNPQVSFGDDVLSRINYTSQGGENLQQLQRAILATLSQMIDEMCGRSGVSRQNIYELAFSGNTTMEHLLCGIDVTPLGQVPFTPAHARALALSADELGLQVHRNAAAYVFPVIGGFVGGDTVACMLATQIAPDNGATLLVDIGTNGEIVLACNGEIRAASTAAGPAFEGARISCGMRATAGAIEKVVFDDDLSYNVIGNVPAIGLCGSALVDLSSRMLSAGIVAPTGRLLPPDELPDSLPPALAERVSLVDGDQTQFLIADDDPARPVILTQRDVRELQLAAGAIRAGIRILLRQAGIAPGDLSRVLLAGGFASFIRRSHAQRIGLLPSEIDRGRIHYVGNASLNGARWALLSTEARKRAEDYARRTKHIELSQDVNFQMEFADAMIFPAS
ncbi:MAG: ASKHA domain-containing protein [Planctomycetota bacterium]|jgi:uncharacterized 2Fe-2S/4Fe-4S cluster protein (DUF4445 family)